MSGNFYIILGVDADASQEEIKAAYRERVMKFHPDHYGENHGPFLAIQEAYATLSDPKKRHAYDRTLQQRKKRAQRAAFVEPLIPNEGRGAGEAFMVRSIDAFSSHFEEMFNHVWSNFAPALVKEKRLQSLTLEIPISRTQAAHGGIFRIVAPVQTICPACRGRGGVGVYDCMHCGGSGFSVREYPLSVSVPPGIGDKFTVQIPLHRIGVRNFNLTITFRVNDY